MPTRMTRVVDQDKFRESQLFYVIVPMTQVEQDKPSDEAVDALYKLWKSAPPGSKTLSASGIDSKLLRNLREYNVIQANGEAIELTDRGRRLISEMVTREPNSFLRNAGDVTYRRVRADKEAFNRPRQTHVQKRRATASRSPRAAYNLREESIRNMMQ
jgi:hypothetical protein